MPDAEEPDGDGKPKPKVDRFVWPQYGYTDTHRRVFEPREPLRGPFRRVWRRRATALLEFSPVIAQRHALPARRRRLARGPQREDGQAPLAAQARHAGRLLARRRGQEPLRHRAGDARRRSRAGACRCACATARSAGRARCRAAPSPRRSSTTGACTSARRTGRSTAWTSATARIIWRYRAAGAVKGSPTLANGLLYFGDYGGQVQAVRASNGRRVWANGSARGLRADGHLLRDRGRRLRPRLHRQHGRAHVLPLRPHRRARLGAPDRQLRLLLGGRQGRSTGSARPSTSAPTTTASTRSTRARARALELRRRRATSPARRPSSATRSTSPAATASARSGSTCGRAAASSGPWEGGYDPVVSDGTYLFLTGYKTISALDAAAGGAPARREHGRRRAPRRQRSGRPSAGAPSSSAPPARTATRRRPASPGRPR